MIEMTLSSRHRIRNSSPGGLRPSTLPLGHGGSPQYDFHTWMGKKHFCFFETAETGNRTPNSGVKGSGANHYPRAPAGAGVTLRGQRWGRGGSSQCRPSSTMLAQHGIYNGSLFSFHMYVCDWKCAQCWFDVGPASTTLANH